MTLRWDAPLVRGVAEELDALLRGESLRGIRLDGKSREAVLLFRRHTVRWRLHPAHGSVALLPPAAPGAGGLGMDTLRTRGRVRRIHAPADERLIRMELLPHGGASSAFDVIVELLGNQWNIVVTEAPEGRIRHVLVRRTGSRPLQVGGLYTPPPPSHRLGADGKLTREEWNRLLEAVPPADPKGFLIRSVAWTSPLNTQALLDEEAGGWELWRLLAAPGIQAGPVLLDPGGARQPYPVALPGAPWKPVPSLLHAFTLEAEAEPGKEEEGAVLFPEDLLRRAEARLDRARRRHTALQARLEATESPDELQALGDLILAHFTRIPAGAEEVTLPGFSGGEVKVSLDPALPPHKNAEHYYRRSARARRARERLPGMIAAAGAEVERWEERVRGAREGKLAPEELQAALPPERKVPPGGSAGAGRERKSLPYRSYHTSGGLEIRVGKGARMNDQLTFAHARPDDVWLHAQQASGAHVILRWGRKETPPSRDLEEAATLAALHSGARHARTVPVLWTFRKFVRKARRSAPGAVIPERARTLFVTPDPEVLARCSGNRQAADAPDPDRPDDEE
ncbi:MAG: NFACT RNA binding domain-containing protein [Gemmatimonadota bacterium]